MAEWLIKLSHSHSHSHSQLWGQGGVDYTVSSFPEHSYWSCGMGVYKPACESYLVESRRPLWFRSSQANLSLSGFNTPALSVGGSVMQHVNNQSPSC